MTQPEASLVQASAFCQRIEQSLADAGEALVTTGDLLGHAEGLGPMRPAVAVGNFSSNTSVLAMDALACCNTIRILLADLPAIGLPNWLSQPSIHPMDILNDAWIPDHDPEQGLNRLPDLMRYARINLAQHALMGGLDVTDGQFILSLSLIDVQSNVAPITASLRDKALSDLVVQSMCWLFEQLSLPVDPGVREALETQIDADRLDRYRQVLAADREKGNRRSSADQDKDDQKPFLPLEYRRLSQMQPDQFEEPVDAEARHRRIDEVFGGHVDLLLAWTRQIDAYEDERILRSLTHRMQRRLRQQPGQYKLANELAHLLPEAGECKQAVSLALALVRSCPEHYRHWWVLGYALKELAWDFRGEDWAYNVDDSLFELFETLLQYARQAVDRALSLHPNHVVMLNLRILLEAGCTRTLIDTLERSIVVAPTYEHSYINALHFSQPRWGGDLAIQMWIVSKAVEHNPDERWPITYCKDLIESNDDYDFTTRMRLRFLRWFSSKWPWNVLDRLQDD